MSLEVGSTHMMQESIVTQKLAPCVRYLNHGSDSGLSVDKRDSVKCIRKYGKAKTSTASSHDLSLVLYLAHAPLQFAHGYSNDSGA